MERIVINADSIPDDLKATILNEGSFMVMEDESRRVNPWICEEHEIPEMTERDDIVAYIIKEKLLPEEGICCIDIDATDVTIYTFDSEEDEYCRFFEVDEEETEFDPELYNIVNGNRHEPDCARQFTLFNSTERLSRHIDRVKEDIASNAIMRACNACDEGFNMNEMIRCLPCGEYSCQVCFSQGYDAKFPSCCYLCVEVGAATVLECESEDHSHQIFDGNFVKCCQCNKIFCFDHNILDIESSYGYQCKNH